MFLMGTELASCQCTWSVASFCVQISFTAENENRTLVHISLLQ